jgi:hypothetical protein
MTVKPEGKTTGLRLSVIQSQESRTKFPTAFDPKQHGMKLRTA